MKVEGLVLEGSRVRLEPLEASDADRLFEIGNDPEIWRWTTSDIESRDDMVRYIDEALSASARGEAVPFVTIDKVSGEVAGSTRFGHIDRENRKVEIGWTWLAKKFQRTHVNTEAKFLMLTHAFEVWECVRVEILTDVNNAVSRKAIRRLGAKEEGILRKHMVLPGGRIRDTVVHSIVDSEWNDIKRRLTEVLKAGKR